jgi:hypothetical protein
MVDHHVDGRSLRLQTAITTRLSSGWSWRMAQVVPPQYFFNIEWYFERLPPLSNMEVGSPSLRDFIVLKLLSRL